jgi:hypothetical protein
MLQVELLYFDGCPSWEPSLVSLKTAIEAEQISAELKLVKIDNSDQAQREHFLGSPSFRVNGTDLWPEERSRYSLNCRVYKTPTGMRGTPTIEMLREEIHRVMALQDNTR